ncbi:gamma-glutamylcyclotransferase [Bacillus taeanensis]|uniref:Gamma-glutamylcyclotransferase family protein n=1 Tax=Bacillus taeanensis TaxID=273032 RepID=A0A366XTQ3_9BACI|nr:gamma-glutamylcyclotransferase [Bacillus taeanensis]
MFVYGSLKKKQSNHYFLKDAACVEEHCWTNGKLYDTGCGYPAVEELPREIVYGELYKVNEEQLYKLDSLEDYFGVGKENLYERITQTIYTNSKKYEAYVYVISEKKKHMLKALIENGIWNK